MLRVSLREIRAHWVRFALSVLAVVLGVAFVAGTFSLRTMLSSTFDSIVESSVQGDAYIRGAHATASGAQEGQLGMELRNAVSTDLVDEIEATDGVARALPDVQGPIVLVGANGTAVINGHAPSIGLALYPDDPTVRMVQGRAPTGPEEIGLESSALVASGLAVGETTTIVLNGQLREVEVVGEGTYGTPTVGTTLVFLDSAVATETFAPEGLVPSIAVYGDDGVSEPDLATALDTVVAAHPGDDLEVLTGEQMRAETSKAINQVIGFIGTFLLVFASISLFVGAFIIGNTFAMSVRQRQREYALLRAVGASPLQVFAVVLGQAAVVGLVGSALGLVSGVALVDLMRTVLDRFGMELSPEASLSTPTVLWSLGLGTAVSMVAAALPARRAALTAPVEAMRDDVTVTERSLRWRAVVGAVLLLAGAAATGVAVRGTVQNTGPWLGGGTGAVLVGMIAISPVIARATLGFLAAPLVATVKPLGRLARGNVTRNPRRTANTAGALMIGMALVAACTVLAASATASTTAIVEGETNADFVVQSATRSVPGDAVAGIQALPDVDRTDALTRAQVEVDGPDGEVAGTTMLGIPPSAFTRTLRVEALGGDLATLADGEVAVHRTAAEENGWTVGDELILRTDVAERTVRIGALTNSQLLFADVVVGDELFTELTGAAPPDVVMVLVDAVPGTDLDVLGEELDGVLAPYVVVTA
ncbi:MAG: ABC transporter permease, partial [Actinomycetales bacterium]|nr:ABC transporter permease [Actinomycetales bacterium]